MARLMARASTLGVTDDQAYQLLNQALKDFANDVRGIVKDEFLRIAALFWVETTFAINLTITGGTAALAATDVAVTASDADAQTGTQMAALLQTAIQAAGATGATVTWADFKFTIDSQDGTDITIAAPTATTTYEDVTEMLLGGTGASGAQTYVGAFPKDCTKRVALPANFQTQRAIEWDEKPLAEDSLRSIQALDGSGDPTRYALGGDDDYLWLDSAPTTRKLLWLEYKAHIADLTGAAAPDFESDFHWGAVWRLAELLCRSQFAEKLADTRHEEYQKVVDSYNERYGNRNTQMATHRDIDEAGWPRTRRGFRYEVL